MTADGALIVTLEMGREAVEPDSRDRLVSTSELVDDTAISAQAWKVLRALGVGPASFRVGFADGVPLGGRR